MPDPKFPKIPSNLDAIFKSASQLKKIEGLVAPRIPPGVEAAFKALKAIPKVVSRCRRLTCRHSRKCGRMR